MNNETKKGNLVPELRFPGFEGEWEMKKFGELCKTITPSLKLQSSNYLKAGKYPIVDQSQSLICGWTNDSKGLISNVPVIIFGDHTCVLKYIDFPFIQGADGVKILSPQSGYDSRFIYQSFLANPVIQDGYKRHFSEFKEKTYMFPSLPEQQKIAECLSSVDDLIQAEADQLQALKDHKKGLIQQLFPQEGETTPKLRFPGFEGEWEEKKLGEVCNVVDDKCDIGSLTIVTYISTENMLQDFEGVKIASKLPNSGSFTRFNKGDILFSNIRPYLRKVWQAVFDGAASNDVIVFRTLDGYDRLFVSQVIKSDRFIAHSMSGAKGVKMPRGDKKMMLDYLFSIPSLPEQQKIADCLSSLDDLIAAQQEKVEALKEHKKGLMQKLFPTIN